MRYVIIGNSAAGVHAVEEIRKRDGEGEIVMFSREPYLAYSRPLITEFLFDGVPVRKMSYRDASFYRDNRVDLRLGVEVVEIDREKKEVLDSRGERTPYDKLLIATGGTPFVPPIKGGDRGGIFTMMTWDSAKAVKERLPKTKRAVVLGGGLIGMKTAEGIYEAGVPTTVVELAPQILGRILDRRGAEIFQDYLEKKGMEIITGDTVEEVVGESEVEAVRLRSGRVLECDLLIVAIGVVPNMDLAKKAGLQVNRGIVVNERMQTSDPDIYAAGDVAEAFDIVVKEKRVNAIWPVANRQGRIAGANMAGGEKVFTGEFPKNSLKLLGLEMISMGLVDSPDDSCQVITRDEGERYVYRKFIFKDGHVLGGIFVGEIDKAGIVTGMIKNGVRMNGNRERLLYGPPQLIYLDEEYREEKLTRPVVS
ncbi:MAG: NAD(P)/FAD-dependent oxidoreductase [Deltaproteobacteria bacterium]|nr:MAG: NAD(P)/FAD-dependent oxidoreductase [Deltaproteobacteria bacterium]